MTRARLLHTTRRPGDTLTLSGPDGRAARISVVEVRGKAVRLAVAAPADVRIGFNEHTLPLQEDGHGDQGARAAGR